MYQLQTSNGVSEYLVELPPDNAPTDQIEMYDAFNHQLQKEDKLSGRLPSKKRKVQGEKAKEIVQSVNRAIGELNEGKKKEKAESSRQTVRDDRTESRGSYKCSSPNRTTE